MTQKNEKRNLLILLVAVVVLGMGMLLWGQYNTALQVYDISFNRYMVTEQLMTDETWAKSFEEEVLYEKVFSEGENWREKTKKRRGFFTAQTASEIFGKSEPLEINYEYFDNESNTTVILLHAYNETVDDSSVFAPYWWEKGFNILIPEMRGHAEGAEQTTFGCYEQYDLLDLIRHEGLNAAGKRLIVHGKGMGAASALLLAGNSEFSDEASLDLIISDNVYSSLKELEIKQLKQQFSLGDFLVGKILDSLAKSRLGFSLKDINIDKAASSMNAPAVFISGDSDGFIGPEQTEAVYQAAGEQKNKLLIKGAGYAMSYAVSKNSGNEYESLLDDWLLKLGML